MLNQTVAKATFMASICVSCVCLSVIRLKLARSFQDDVLYVVPEPSLGFYIKYLFWQSVQQAISPVPLPGIFLLTFFLLTSPFSV